MSSFTSPLVYSDTGRKFHGRPVFRLSRAFTYVVGQVGSGYRVSVPVGFETDLASISMGLRRWFPPDGPYAKAAVVHDWLYRCGYVERWMADAIFYDAMTNPNLPDEHRVAYRFALPVYYAVRLFGWLKYRPRLHPGADLLTQGG